MCRDFTGYYRKIPVAWIIAHKALSTLEPKLMFRMTDCSHILHGEVSLSHILNVTKAHRKVIPDGRTIKMLSLRGITQLADIGTWRTVNGILKKFESVLNVPSGVNWTAKAKENWVRIAQILNELEAKWFTIGDVDLMTTRAARKSRAETYLRTLARIQPLPSSNLPHNRSNWASDGSMIPAVSGIGDPKSVTAALTGPTTLVLRISSRNVLILQGELVGLVVGLTQTTGNPQSSTLHTDHLNSVRLIQDLRSEVGQENRLRNMNGRSYYRWIADLLK
jgi:hypothetical protein